MIQSHYPKPTSPTPIARVASPPVAPERDSSDPDHFSPSVDNARLIGLTGFTLVSAIPFLGAATLGEVAQQEPEHAQLFRIGGFANLAGSLALLVGLGPLGAGALGVGAGFALYGMLRAESS